MTVIRACSNQLWTSVPGAVSLRTILDSLDRRPTRRGASLAPGGPWHDEWTGGCETGLNRNWSGRIAPGFPLRRNPPSTTRVRSQSPAGSGPLRSTWRAAGSRRDRPCASVSAALGASAFSLQNRSVYDRTGDHPAHRLLRPRCAPNSRGLCRQPCRQNGSRGFGEPRPQRRAPYKGKPAHLFRCSGPGVFRSSTNSRRKLGKGCRRGGTSRVLSGADSVP